MRVTSIPIQAATRINAQNWWLCFLCEKEKDFPRKMYSDSFFFVVIYSNACSELCASCGRRNGGISKHLLRLEINSAIGIDESGTYYFDSDGIIVTISLWNIFEQNHLHQELSTAIVISSCFEMLFALAVLCMQSSLLKTYFGNWIDSFVVYSPLRIPGI